MSKDNSNNIEPSTEPNFSILVVDDNEWNRDTLARRLQRKGIKAVVAESGKKALELIGQESFSLILLDVMMPEVNGLQVLEAVRKQFTPLELPIIMTTAKGENTNIIDALELGANDYVTKPIDFPVAFARIQTHLLLNKSFKDIQALKQNLSEQNEKLERANRRMNRDLEAAAAIQQSQLPSELPNIPGIHFEWLFEPHEKLAGDMLHILPLSERKAAFFVLDVSGHGAPAALLSVSVSRHIVGLTLDNQNKLLDNPDKLIHYLNQRFTMDSMGGNFFTIAYGVLDMDTLELRYALAGHPGMVHLPINGKPAVLDQPAIPIGLFSDSTYQVNKVQLNKGDRIFMYSDGIIEAMNDEGNTFGKENLKNALENCSNLDLSATFKKVLSRVREWCKPRRPTDDLTILGISLNQ